MLTLTKDLIFSNIPCEKDMNMYIFSGILLESAEIIKQLINNKINFLIGNQALIKFLSFIDASVIENMSIFGDHTKGSVYYKLVDISLNNTKDNNVYLFNFNNNLNRIEFRNNGISKNDVSFSNIDKNDLMVNITTLIDTFVDGKSDSDSLIFNNDFSKSNDDILDLVILKAKLVTLINESNFDDINFVKNVDDSNFVFKFC